MDRYEKTSETLKKISSIMQSYAKDIDFYADQVLKQKDFDYAAFGLAAVKNCFGMLPLDKLAIHPMRFYVEKQQEE